MTWQMMLFVITLLINMLVVVVYWFFNFPLSKKGERKDFLVCGFVMLICPVIGPCFFGLAQIFYKVFFSQPVDLEGVIFSKERVQTFVWADEESERNMVPLEEAIEVASTDDLRNLMMNIVRGDISNSLATIALALNSGDTETAHYAASVLQDALNEFRSTVQKGRLQIIDEEKDDIMATHAGILIDYMDQVLKQRVLTDIEQRDYALIMDEIGDILYEKDQMHITGSQYEELALRLLEIEDFERCQKWCDRAIYQYPNTLSTFTCQLKLYFNSGQRERFFEVINELKRSSIVIDSQTLELIRAFQ